MSDYDTKALEAARAAEPPPGWRPAVGDFVVEVPHHPALAPYPTPLRVTSVSQEASERPSYWCRPLGPEITRTLRDGRVVKHTPTHETLQSLSTLRPWPARR